MNLTEKYILNPEWKREPSYKQFEYKDYPCVIIRDSLGILHGYVGLPAYNEYNDGHLLSGVHPHGGLSFEDNSRGDLHTHYYGQELYWIGFFCGHKDDLIPAFVETRYKGKIYRNILFVENEIRNMVDQIIRNR